MARRLDYMIGLNIDASKLNGQLTQAFQALRNISKNATGNFAITEELKQGVIAANQIESILKGSINMETGKLDLAAFQRSLASSGTSLAALQQQMMGLGNEGARAFQSVAQSIASAEVPINHNMKLLDSLWTTMKNTVRWQITTSALRTFIGSVESAMGYVQDLDSSLNHIRIVTGQSAEQMAEFAEQANQAAQRLSTTTTEYTDASLIYYQQGLPEEEVKARTDITVKLANVTGQSAEDTSQQLTAVWNNFSEGADDLEHFADVMVKLGAETASSSDEIAEGLQKFAAVASTIGMSYDASAAALATLTAETRESASVVGTSLRTLFSRLQGLKLGDTLEDGTDLNKYSEALNTVGVKIKDTSGELREMEDILFDLGEVWPTLTRDQQVALATTVAGVRQYTQLVALMNNWGDFQKNLARAQSADGSLTTQADIYAESWEAARDQVKNAAQDIYDSLLNPQFFAAFDNGLAVVLHRIADIIDGFGGFSGVLSLVSNLMLKAFGSQIASGIRSIGYELGFITKQTNETLESLRSEAVQLAKNTKVAQEYVETFSYKAPINKTANNLLQGYDANLTERKFSLGADYDREYTGPELRKIREQILNSQDYKDYAAAMKNLQKMPASAARTQALYDWDDLYKEYIGKRQPSAGESKPERPGLTDIDRVLAQYDQLEKKQQQILDKTDQIVTANSNLKKITPYGDIEQNAVNNLTAQAQLQDKINSKLSSMNGLERERVQAMVSQIDLMQQSVDLITAEGRAAQQTLKARTEDYQGMMERIQTNIPWSDQIGTGLQASASIMTTRQANKYNLGHTDEAQMVSARAVQNYLHGMGQSITKDTDISQLVDQFNVMMQTGDQVTDKFAGLTDQITALAQRSANLKVLQAALREPGVTADKLSQSMQALAEQVNILGQNGEQVKLEDLTGAQVSEAISETKTRLSELKSFATEVFNVDPRVLDQYVVANAIAAEKTAETARAQESLRTAIQQTNTAIENGAYKVVDFAQRMVTAAQSLSQFGMMASSINGVMNNIGTLMSGTGDVASLVTSSLFGLGMAATNIIGITNSLNKTFRAMISTEGGVIAANEGFAASSLVVNRASRLAANGAEIQAAATQAASEAAMFASAGIAILVVGLLGAIKAYDYFSKAGERAREAIEESTQAYQDQASTVESLQNELTQKQQRLEELAAMPSRTNQEQEELEALKQQIPYLERKLKLAQDNLKVAQAEALLSLQENMDTAYKDLTTPGANSAETYYGRYVSSQDALEKFHPDSLESLAQAEYYMQFGDTLGGLQKQIDATIEKRDELLADKSGDIRANQQAVEKTNETLSKLTAQYDQTKAAMDAWTEDWINNHLDIQDEVEAQMEEWSANQAANFEKFRAQGEILLDSMGDDFQGWITKRGNEKLLDDVTSGLSTAYKNMYGEADYADTFLQPLMESTGVLDDIRQKVASFNQQQITIDVDPYREELARSLVNTDDFVNYVQERVAGVQDSLNGIFENDFNLRDSFIQGLSDSEYTALFKVDLEGVDDFNDLYTKIYELTSNQQVVDLDVGTESLSSAVDEILNLKKDEFSLSPETIANLQEQFAGIFDFRALSYESLAEQAQILSEAFSYLSDPDSMMETINDGLEDMRGELKEVNKEISSTQKQLSKLGPGAGRAASEINKELQKLQKRKIQIEVDTKTAQKQLEKINEFKIKDKTFELKLEGAKAVLAQASAIEKAAQYIEKGWQVSGQNITEFIQAWPEALKGAQVNMMTGMVQLDEQWLAHLRDTINQSVAATVLGANAELNTRLAQYSTEMDYLSQVAQAAEQGSHQALTAVTGDSQEEVRIRNMAMRDIVLAKIEQCVQEKTQSGLAAQNAIDAQNQVTDASKNEGEAVSSNWNRVAIAVEKSLWDAFSAGSQYQQALANGQDMGRIAVKASSAVGLKDSGSSYKAPALGGDKGAAGSGGTGNSWEEPDYYDLVKEQLGEDAAALYQYALSDMTSPFRDDENGTDWKHYSELNPEGAQAYLDRMAKAGQALGLNINSEAFTGKTPEDRWDSFVHNYEANTSPQQIRQDAQSAWDRRMHINAEDILRAAQAASPGGAAKDAWDKGYQKPSSSKDKSPSEKEPKEAKEEDLEEPKELDDLLDRYHEITRAIEDQAEVLEDIDNYMDLAYGQERLNQFATKISNLTKQLSNYETKLEEAQSYLPLDQAELQQYFEGYKIDFDPITGEIRDYKALVQQMLDQYNGVIEEYNAFITKYNSMTGDEQDEESVKKELDHWKDRKKQADETLEKQQAVVDKYEEALDVINEMNNEIEETNRLIESAKLERITYKIDVVFEVKETKDAVRNFVKEITESVSDSLYHTVNGLADQFNNRGTAEMAYAQVGAERALLVNLEDEYNRLEERLSQANIYTNLTDIKEEFADLQEEAIESGEAIMEWINSLEELLPEALEDASSRLELFTNQLEHNKTILETIQELYDLQGVTYKLQNNFDMLQNTARVKRDTATEQAIANKQWSEQIYAQLQQAQQAYDAAEAEWNLTHQNGESFEGSFAYDTLKANRDALLEEYNEAQEALFESAQEAMEIAQEMYIEQIEHTVWEFGQRLSNDIGLDLMQTKYDHYIEEEERYLDKVNEAYQVSQWYVQLQSDIEKSKNGVMQQRLKDLMEEIHLRRQNNELSEYDLDIIKAKYEVLKAQMALEDVQDNKNQLRLVRDRQGNWNYQFTADPDELADKEKDLLDRENEWYNIAKKQVKDVTGEIIDAWNECQDDIKEIYEDMSLTDQERADRAAEIYDYYTKKIEYLESEKQIAIADMTEAGNAQLFDSAVLAGDEITDLTGTTAEDIKNLMKESGNSIIELLIMDNEQIKEIVGSNTSLIDDFENVYGSDLAKMTENTSIFESCLRDALDRCQNYFSNYNSVVQDIGGKSGTAINGITKKTDILEESTNNVSHALDDVIPKIGDMVRKVHDATQAYADLATKMAEVISKAKEIATNSGNAVNSLAGLRDDEIDDYDAAIEFGIKKGFFNYGSDIYKELFSQREDRIDTRNMRDEVEYYGEAASEHYQQQKSGEALSKWTQERYGDGKAGILRWLQDLAQLGFDVSGFKKMASLDTGGYTGEFEDGRIALLHEKELVLNPQDTQNILSTVGMVRSLSPDLLSSIAQKLEIAARVATSLADHLTGAASIPTMMTETLDQNVHIEASFPNVVDSSEIIEAFNSLTNDAAQWAQLRRG